MTLFSFKCITSKNTNRAVLLWTLGMIGLVTGGVFYYVGDKGPSGLRGKHIDLIALIFGFVFVVLGTWWFFKKRFPVTITRVNHLLVLRVDDPALPQPIEVMAPFYVAMEWTNQTIYPGKPTVRMLFITLYHAGGNPQVTFRGGYGKAREIPPGFMYYEEKYGPRKKHASAMYDINQMNGMEALATLFKKE